MGIWVTLCFQKELNISNKLEYEWIEIYYVFDCDEMKSVFIQFVNFPNEL